MGSVLQDNAAVLTPNLDALVASDTIYLAMPWHTQLMLFYDRLADESNVVN